jgi:hypothetical protein
LFVEHIVFSDGYSSQFKCGRSLFYKAHYLSLTKCDELGTWNLHAVNYFDSGHGKGWWDEAGVSIKHALCFEQVKPIGAIFHNAPNVVNFSQGHFNQDYASYSHVCKDVQHLFYEVKPTNVN